jgi:hypothetical protein
MLPYLNKYYGKTLCIRFFTNSGSLIILILITSLGGCVNDNQYCGISYRDLGRVFVTPVRTIAPEVVVPYTTKDLESNPFFYPPQPPLGCIEQ